MGWYTYITNFTLSVNISMDSKLEKYIIALLIIILISLAACAKPAKEYKPGPFGVVVDHAEGIGTMIGCMFNPKILLITSLYRRQIWYRDQTVTRLATQCDVGVSLQSKTHPLFCIQQWHMHTVLCILELDFYNPEMSHFFSFTCCII